MEKPWTGAPRPRLDFALLWRHLNPMSITATVSDGKIVLPPEAQWPNGSVVRVELLNEEQLPTLLEDMKDFIGVVDDLPADMAENHNHYLHGYPKQ